LMNHHVFEVGQITREQGPKCLIFVVMGYGGVFSGATARILSRKEGQDLVEGFRDRKLTSSCVPD
jgi:hypothetical protein